MLYWCASVCFSILLSNLVDIQDILATHQVIVLLEAIRQPLTLVVFRQPRVLELIVLQPRVVGATLQHKVQVTHQPLGQETTHLPEELANTTRLLAP